MFLTANLPILWYHTGNFLMQYDFVSRDIFVSSNVVNTNIKVKDSERNYDYDNIENNDNKDNNYNNNDNYFCHCHRYH